MHRVARVLIAFIMAVAVPWQAVAAATMVDLPSPSPSPSLSLSASLSHHEHRAMAHEPNGAGHAAHHVERHESTKSKCGAGSSCCVAVAPPSAQADFDAPTFSQRIAPAPPADRAPFLTAGLDRPPRTDLA